MILTGSTIKLTPFKRFVTSSSLLGAVRCNPCLAVMDWYREAHSGGHNRRGRGGHSGRSRSSSGHRSYHSQSDRGASNYGGGANDGGSFWGDEGRSGRYGREEGKSSNYGRDERRSGSHWRERRGGRGERRERDADSADPERGRGGGGRPPGLRGKAIGMWFAQKGRARKIKEERENKAYVQLDKAQERQITGLLASIRSSDHCPPQPSRSYQDPFLEDEEPKVENRASFLLGENEDTPDSWTERVDSADKQASSSEKNYSTFAGQDFIPLDMDEVMPTTSRGQAAAIDRKRKSDELSGSSFDDDVDSEKLVKMAEQMERNYQAMGKNIEDGEELEGEAVQLYDYMGEEEESDFLYEFKQQRLANRRSHERLDELGMLGRHKALFRDVAFDQAQLELFRTKQQSPDYQEMLKFRKRLPSYDMREELLSVIGANQVTVISGETGCGKTTQVSQFILDDYVARGDASVCRIVCTQPRRISAISVAERVADERCERCGENSVGFQIRLEKKSPNTRGSILYCTTGILLQWLASNPLLAGTTHVILDEIHERDLHSDFLMIILRDVLPRRPDLKVILMSATLNAEMFSKYFHGCPMLNIPGFTYPVTDHYLEDVIEMIRYKHGDPPPPVRVPRGRKGREKAEEVQMYFDWCDDQMYNRYSRDTIQVLKGSDCGKADVDLAAQLTEHICRNKPDGAILVFMPGWEQIKKMNELLTKKPFFNNGKFLILPLHSLLPTANQRQVFERPPKGVRKIVIATNIAETSITIDDVVYVIDCGKIKLKNFDSENNLSTLNAEWVSKANARQRRGRAGRVQAGECYHLFTRYHLDTLQDYQLPEMLRTRLEELCLQIKLLKLGRIEPFVQKAMQPPSLEALRRSLEMLRDISALDDHEELTPLGYHLAKMPMDPQTGKMLLFAAMFSCLDPILTVGASLSYKDAFVIPMGKEREADERRRKLADASHSDHIMLANAYKGWERARGRRTDRQYCWDNFLSPNVLTLLCDMRKQFCKLLYEMKFIPSPDPKNPASNMNSDKEAILKAVICAGLYPNVAKVDKLKKRPGPKPSLLRAGKDKVYLHPKSVNENECSPPSRWCVYYLKQKTMKVFLYDSTYVSPLSILLFGGDINLRQEKNDLCEVTIDEWIKFASSGKIATLVRELRVELDKLLEYKITHPGPTDWNSSSKEGALMRAIIDVINKEEMTTLGNVESENGTKS